MFEKVTRSLLHQTDQDGTLIAVSRLNDSEKLKPLAVVVKCPGTRFWQRTKYKVTDFTLSDLLQGKPIQPVLRSSPGFLRTSVEKKASLKPRSQHCGIILTNNRTKVLKERVFLNNYEETKKGSVVGSGEVDMVGVNMKAQGHGTSKILSSLGKLLKESVIMQPFLEDSKGRKVDPQHSLIMQLQGKNQFFTLVKERIFTTSDCKINVSELKEGSCNVLLHLLSPAKVHLYKSLGLQTTRDVAIEIPPQTVMAYSVSELIIESDGHYEVGVNPDGLEADTQHLIHNETEMDSFWPLTEITEGSSLSALNKELASVKATLCQLACLPPETCLSLLNLFQKILPDQTLLSTLQDKLENMCGEPMDDSHTYSPDTSNELTDHFLDLLQSETDDMDWLPTGPNGSPPAISNQNGGQSAPASWKAATTSHNGSSVKPTNRRHSILNAMCMLISATEEMTNHGLALIKTFSSETINGLNELVTLLTKSPEPVPVGELPLRLRDGEVPEEVELLFILSNITLKRDNKQLYAEIGSGSKVLPVVLCIVIHGLAYLNESCETDI